MSCCRVSSVWASPHSHLGPSQETPRLRRSKRTSGTRARRPGPREQLAQKQTAHWACCGLPGGKASWCPLCPSLLLSSVLPLPVPQVDEAQRRMDAEIWQLLSSFAARPHPPAPGLLRHPQPAAALQAAPLSSSSSSSPSSASGPSSAGSQVCAKVPAERPPTHRVF